MTVSTDKMQTPGTYISAVGHVGLIGWLLLGLGMQSQPTPMEAMDVTVMSGEEFEQMMAARTPEPGTEEPEAAAPQPVIEDAPPPPPPPPAAPDPEPAPAPEPVAPPPPPPPPPAPATPDLPPSDDPTPAPADRVAATPVAPPPPDAQISDIPLEAIVPDDTAPAEVVVPEQLAAAPEETATEIVIEDETPRGAVETSLRPVARPARPVPPTPEPEEQVAATEPDPVAEEEPAPEPTPDPDPTPAPVPDTSAAVEDALAAALAESAAPAVPAGPPMTGSERDSFRIAVNSCWNVDPGSVAARVTVEVAFNLTREGRVDGEPRLLSASGDESATSTAFEAARRAILRCQGGGYQLPADKYDQWREVVITFDPSGMRLR